MKVFIRSTDTDRTLMSVESLMAAFYKPVERQVGYVVVILFISCYKILQNLLKSTVLDYF